MENEVPLPERQSEERSHKLLYTLLGVAIGALLVIALVAYEGGKDDKQSRDKAEQLSRLYEENGLGDERDIDQLVAVYGNHGGFACDVDQSALEASINQMITAGGTGGVGGRPVVADTDLLQSTELMMQVYCPDKLEAIQGYIDDLETKNTIDD